MAEAAPAPVATPAPAPAPAITTVNPGVTKVAEPNTPVANDPKAEAKGYWPDDWLAKVSKGDEKISKQLGRYQSPEALAEAHIALRRRMDSGEFKTALPKDAKPEELAAWRKDNGIPETPDKYDLKDLKIDDTDKPLVDGFVKRAHELNMAPEHVKATLEYRAQERTRLAEERATKDEDQRVKTLDSLNQEWGGSFRRNVNLVNGMLDRFPADVKEALKSARMPDGTAIFNDPSVLKGFVAMALEANPAGVIVPAGGGEPGKVALDEYQELQKFMREDRNGYLKDNNKQARMRELIDYLSKNGMIDNQGNAKKAA